MDGSAPINPRLNTKIVGLELLQNCDLPPPLKVFTGLNKTVISSMDRNCRLIGKVDDHQDKDLNIYTSDNNDKKLELLKALRLSQTRAREAEKEAATLALERDRLSNSLLDQAREMFAYRQWVRFLELKISSLNQKWVPSKKHACYDCGSSKIVKIMEEGDEGEGVSFSWMFALKLCLGIAGVGFVLGCRYLF